MTRHSARENLPCCRIYKDDLFFLEEILRKNLEHETIKNLSFKIKFGNKTSESESIKKLLKTHDIPDRVYDLTIMSYSSNERVTIKFHSGLPSESFSELSGPNLTTIEGMQKQIIDLVNKRKTHHFIFNNIIGILSIALLLSVLVAANIIYIYNYFNFLGLVTLSFYPLIAISFILHKIFPNAIIELKADYDKKHFVLSDILIWVFSLIIGIMITNIFKILLFK
jgi:hypothetical protein